MPQRRSNPMGKSNQRDGKEMSRFEWKKTMELSIRGWGTPPKYVWCLTHSILPECRPRPRSSQNLPTQLPLSRFWRLRLVASSLKPLQRHASRSIVGIIALAAPASQPVRPPSASASLGSSDIISLLIGWPVLPCISDLRLGPRQVN